MFAVFTLVSAEEEAQTDACCCSLETGYYTLSEGGSLHTGDDCRETGAALAPEIHNCTVSGILGYVCAVAGGGSETGSPHRFQAPAYAVSQGFHTNEQFSLFSGI